MLVIIAGMIRSGSTFSFNVARELLTQTGEVSAFSGNSIQEAILSSPRRKHFLLKTHAPDALTTELIRLGALPCICTLRRPEDAIGSWMTTFGVSLEASIETMRVWLLWYQGMKDAVKLIRFEQIESTRIEAITEIHRYLIGREDSTLAFGQSNRYEKKRLQSWLDNMPPSENTIDIGMSYYDSETYFHRRHISTTSAVLSDAQRLVVYAELKDFVDADGNVLGVGSPPY